jgi:RNA polymerase primary sigma factor
MQALAEHSRIVRLPMNRVSSYNKISRTFSELEQKFQREPMADELAEALDMSESEVQNNMTVSNRKVSMDAPFANGEGSSLLDVMENDQIETTDSALLKDSLRTEVQLALSTLTARESEVISSYYGLNGEQPMTLEEIGEKFSLTRERVRQIKEKATKRLRHNSSGTALKAYL